MYSKNTEHLRLLKDYFPKLAIHKWTKTHLCEIITCMVLQNANCKNCCPSDFVSREHAMYAVVLA